MKTPNMDRPLKGITISTPAWEALKGSQLAFRQATMIELMDLVSAFIREPEQATVFAAYCTSRNK